MSNIVFQGSTNVCATNLCIFDDTIGPTDMIEVHFVTIPGSSLALNTVTLAAQRSDTFVTLSICTWYNAQPPYRNFLNIINPLIPDAEGLTNDEEVCELTSTPHW